MESLAFFALQWIAIVFLGLMLVLALFEPALPYKVTAIPSEPLDSPGFRRLLAVARRLARSTTAARSRS